MKPQDSLRQSADVFEERGRVYGDAYKNFGHVMMALRPSGFAIRNVEDANRLGVFTQIVSKIVRYANQFEAGGHDDSLLDLATYAAMLRELDAEGRVPTIARGSLSKEEIDEIQEAIRRNPGRIEPHGNFPVADSVVPRGSGFRVGEIEPRKVWAEEYARASARQYGIGDGQDMVRE